MAKFVKIGPVYINLDMVASIDTENMAILVNTGAGLEGIEFNCGEFESEEEFEKEIDLKLSLTRQFE